MMAEVGGSGRLPGPVTLAAAGFASLEADPPLSSVLGQLLGHSRRLVDAMAGSVSLVDSARDRYSKLAEYGASCQLGRTFPLGEGVTGQVMSRRRPVVLASYGDVPTGHLPRTHPASRGAVAAVPIWWLGDVIGANVVFAGGRSEFTAHQVDQLELISQVAAPGIVRAGGRGPSSAVVRPRPPAPTPAPSSTSGVRPTPRELEVLELIAMGLSDPEVAVALGISRKTAEKHVGALLRKTGSTRRTAAVVRALDWGWMGRGVSDPSR